VFKTFIANNKIKMSFSYSGITNYGKVSLPSVESWGTNNNILRDPPKSITTRRIDKVFDTSMLDQEIQESGNRVAESILVYPRGINPMVGVSFDNFGSNAGNRMGQQLFYKGQQSKMPYRVNKDGAFRPPILRPVDLLPLSRLPRNKTSIAPIANIADFTKKIICPGEAKDYRSVKDVKINLDVSSSKHQYIRKPQEIGVSQNIINQLLKKSTDARLKYNPNAVQNTTEKYTKNSIQNHVQYESFTNPSQNINVRNTESRLGKQLQDRIQGSMHSNVKGQVTKVQYHEVEELKTKPETKLLRGNVHINSTYSGLSNGQIQNKSVKLAPKLNLGSQEGSMLRPQTERITDYTNVNLKRKK
jgi:hypothetical protein